MKIIIAPDSFKESLTARQAATAIARGLRRALPEAELLTLPVADGGEGTTDALVDATGGQSMPAPAIDPLGTPVTASWGLLGDGQTAVVEVAAASGLDLVPRAQRDPWRASSAGTGALVRAALDHGCRRLIIGLGGSATNDGGAGLLHALGARFLDNDGAALAPHPAALMQLARIDLSQLDPRLRTLPIDVACDVTNPLLGPEGATAVFGPQKGVTGKHQEKLEAFMQRLARCLCEATGQDHRATPGAGAAGGIGFALLSTMMVTLKSGIDIVLDTLDIDTHLPDTDLVITGEGRLDGQTAQGKAPAGLARRAARHGVPAIALAGTVSADLPQQPDDALTAVFSILPELMLLENAIGGAERNLEAVAYNLGRVLGLRKGLGEMSDV